MTINSNNLNARFAIKIKDLSDPPENFTSANSIEFFELYHQYQIQLTDVDGWKRELKSAFKSTSQLLEYLQIPKDALVESKFAPLLEKQSFPLLVTKHFVDLMEPGNIDDPLLLQVLPNSSELIEREDFVPQPLDEQDSFVPVNNIVHKYSQRLLFLPKASCAINCRYCFRRNFPYQELVSTKADWARALDYVYDQGIKELILSGGDPLMMNDKEFLWLITQIYQRNQNQLTPNTNPTKLSSEDLEAYLGNPGVRRIRIHSRLPVVIPSRLSENFANICKLAREEFGIEVVLVLHTNHPREISPQLVQGLERLANVKVTLLNQSVLLKGVNDSATVLHHLSEKLFATRVLPYYLHLLDRVTGATQFLVEDDEARKIYRELQSLASGFLVPKLAREEVGEKHKTIYS